VPTARSAQALALSMGVDMPIVSTVHGILFDGVAPADAIAALMTRDLRGERD
jgi:glycerol-3-phosphate dehydrogenase (NAD(P)+)